ncbi:unnamed protein product [Jaminaea pallidilutea]
MLTATTILQRIPWSAIAQSTLAWTIAVTPWIVLALTVVATRVWFVLPKTQQWIQKRRESGKSASTKDSADPKRSSDSSVTTAVFLGSGGHTTELLLLLSSLDEKRYSPRIFIVSSGDDFSASKARQWQKDHRGRGVDSGDDDVVVPLPRARNVHQSWLSTPLTTIVSFWACLKLMRQGPNSTSHVKGKPSSPSRPFADLVLLNGPGTCVPLVAAIYVDKILSRPTPKVIYVESFARVRSLSLTAKILRHFVDRFVVQWPSALGATPKQSQQHHNLDGTSEETSHENEVCRGWLV